MTQVDVWGYFSEGERIVLENIGIEMNLQGMRFTSPPSWSDFTLAFAYISGLSRRVPAEPDQFGFVIGDCLLEGNRYFGEERVDEWLVEFGKLVRLRDVVLNMTGGLLIHLQQVENSIKGCCAYLEVEGIDIDPGDLLSTDKKKRVYTLGRMATAFRKTGVFNTKFEQRLALFVKERNHFIHEFWVQRISASAKSSALPSVDDYKEIMEFISRLGGEASYIENVFQGLLFEVLYRIGLEHWPDKVGELQVDRWRTYIEHYRRAA